MFAVEAAVMKEFFEDVTDIAESDEMDTPIDLLIGDDEELSDEMEEI